jgi:uncharacterized protein (DUF2141 family)
LKIKAICILILFFLIITSDGVFSRDSITVYVSVEGFNNSDGICRLLLFKEEKGFPDEPSNAELMLSGKIQNRKIKFIFKIIPGKYALSILHDQNSNQKMDKTWYGKPKEGFGVSTNPEIGFGPPDFDESIVNINEKNSHILIKLNYL